MQSRLSYYHVLVVLGLMLAALSPAMLKQRVLAQEDKPVEDNIALAARVYAPGALARNVRSDLLLQDTPASEPLSPNAGAAQGDWSKAVYSRYVDGSFDIFFVLPGISEERLTQTSSVDEVEGRLNGDGTRLVYTTLVGDVAKIFRRHIGEHTSIQLTNQGNNSYPFWSPDGAKIVFQSDRDGQSEIYIMDADGSNQTRLTNDPDYDGQPSFTPDGQHILFISRRTGGYRVYRMDVDGSNLVQLSNVPYSARPFATYDGLLFSADGDLDGWMELWKSDFDGSNARKIMSPGYHQDLLASLGAMGGGYTRLTWIQVDGTWYIQKAEISAPFGDTLSWGYDWISLDKQPPVTTIQPLPSVSPHDVGVTVSALDYGPAGLLSSYPTTVQYRDGLDGEWVTIEPWAHWWTEFAFYGVGGHTYYVRARSIDNGFNVEPWPDTPQAVTTIESISPVSVFAPIGRFQPRTFSWPVSAWDIGGSGVVSNGVQAQAREQGIAAWTDVPVDGSGGRVFSGSLSFTGATGNTYTFRIRAQDGAQNWEDWHTAPISVTLYSWQLHGQVTDIADTPLAGVSGRLTQSEVGSLPSDLNGQYHIYGVDAYTHTVSWQRDGQGIGVTAVYTDDYWNSTPESVNLIAPPADDLIQNGDFENGMAAWSISGSYPGAVASGKYQGMGTRLFSLGQESHLMSTAIISSASSYGRMSSPLIIRDSQNTMHIFAISDQDNSRRILHLQQDSNGDWSEPQTLLTSTGQPALKRVFALSDGTLRVLMQDPSSARWFLIDRTLDGSVASRVIDVPSSASLTTVQDGDTIHGVYDVYDNTMGRYVYRWVRILPDGNLSPSEIVPVPSDGNSISRSAVLFVAPNGDVYVAFNYYNAHVIYVAVRSAATGLWGDPEHVLGEMYGDYLLAPRASWMDEQGNCHVLAESVWEYKLYDLQKKNNEWQPPYLVYEASGRMYPKASVDPSGYVHVFGREGSDLFYRQGTPSGEWMPVESIPQFSVIDGAVARRLPDGNVYAYVGGGVFLKRDAQTGKWTVIAASNGTLTSHFSAFIDAHGILHEAMVDNAHSPFLFYVTPHLVASDSSVNLTQSVGIPPTATNPTLSFLAKLEKVWEDGFPLSVNISDAGGSTSSLPWHTRLMDDGWTHYWADVSAWKGQTITLTFEMSRQPGDMDALVLLDQVHLGSVYPDVWTRIDAPRGASPGRVIPIRIQYGNRGSYEAHGVELNVTLSDTLHMVSSTLTPTLVSQNTLKWTLGTLNGEEQGSVVLWLEVETPPAAQDMMGVQAEVLDDEPGDANLANNRATKVMDFQEWIFLPLLTR